MKVTGIIIVTLVLIAMTGIVMADARIPATPEIQGISTSTSINALGTVAQTDSLTWVITNKGNLTPPLIHHQTVFTTTYDDKLSAVSGQTTWKKDAAISTADQVGSQQNIKMDANLQYEADGTGRATREESIVLDGASDPLEMDEIYMCPFAEDVIAHNPAFCNYISAGSRIDTTLTSTVTQAKESFVGKYTDFPVTVGYSIAAKGITYSDGTVPMLGSASANVVVSIKEEREPWSGYPSETLDYKGKTDSSGWINSFNKEFSYQGGMIIV
jgi:hypothetical protein